MSHSVRLQFAALAATLFMTTSNALAGAPSGPVKLDVVNLTAWLHVDDLTMADVVVELEIDGDVQRGVVGENGRFELSLPADVQALLRFTKPGHLPKEVVVDTRHVNEGGFDGKTRNVSFAVILEAERHMAGLTYPGPVGSLRFEQGGGCLAVDHDQRKVPAHAVQRETIVVF